LDEKKMLRKKFQRELQSNLCNKIAKFLKSISKWAQSNLSWPKPLTDVLLTELEIKSSVFTGDMDQAATYAKRTKRAYL
jgi:hypothetical protein